MKGGFSFSISVHVLLLLLLLFGLPFWHPKPHELPPMISVDVIDLGKEPTTNKIAPANKVEKIVHDDTPPSPSKPPPSREMPDPAPKVDTVDSNVAQIEAPDVSLKKLPTPVPKLDTVDDKLADLTPPPKVELKRPQPKAPSASFDSVLKNLTKQKLPDTPTPTPPQPVKTPTQLATGALAQLSDKLTASEMDALKQQLSQCWNIPASVKDAQDLVVELDVEVNPDRSVASATIVDQGRMASDPVFRAAALSAKRALSIPACMPLALPPDKYDEWKSMTLRFDPKEMLGL